MASLLTSIGSAQTNHELSLARALFEEGVQLADQGDWAGAADRFERAHTLKPSAGIAYNWASALGELGKLMQAAELLEAVLRDAKASPELRAESEKKLQELAPRRARLKLHVADDVPEGSDVRVDGRPWPAPVWDVAMPVDPGAHRATCQRQGQELCSAEIQLAEGESGELTLALTPPPVKPERPLTPPAPEPEAPKRPVYKSWILWTSVGVAVVGGAVAVALLAHKGGGSEAPVEGNAQPGVVRW